MLRTLSHRSLLLGALAALAAGTGVAFAGWMEHGPQMFLSLAASGLSWCF